MEDLIAEYPQEFFPRKSLRLQGRQKSFREVGRFDLLFSDEFGTQILMELKAVTAKYEDATQLAKYRDALLANGTANALMWLVAPSIPRSVRDFLDHIGIEYTENSRTRVPKHCGASQLLVRERNSREESFRTDAPAAAFAPTGLGGGLVLQHGRGRNSRERSVPEDA